MPWTILWVLMTVISSTVHFFMLIQDCFNCFHCNHQLWSGKFGRNSCFFFSCGHTPPSPTVAHWPLELRHVEGSASLGVDGRWQLLPWMVAVEGQGRCAFATQDLPAREMLLEEGEACLGVTFHRSRSEQTSNLYWTITGDYWYVPKLLCIIVWFLCFSKRWQPSVCLSRRSPSIPGCLLHSCRVVLNGIRPCDLSRTRFSDTSKSRKIPSSPSWRCTFGRFNSSSYAHVKL